MFLGFYRWPLCFFLTLYSCINFLRGQSGSQCYPRLTSPSRRLSSRVVWRLFFWFFSRSAEEERHQFLLICWRVTSFWFIKKRPRQIELLPAVFYRFQSYSSLIQSRLSAKLTPLSLFQVSPCLFLLVWSVSSLRSDFLFPEKIWSFPSTGYPIFQADTVWAFPTSELNWFLPVVVKTSDILQLSASLPLRWDYSLLLESLPREETSRAKSFLSPAQCFLSWSCSRFRVPHSSL